MQDETNQWVALVSKVNALTQDNLLTWQHFSPKESNSVIGALVGQVDTYDAKYKDKGFRLSKLPAFGSGGMTSSIRLEIIDGNGKTLWKVPDVVGLNDLFQSVLLQSTGVRKFIDDLLNEDEKASGYKPRPQ